MEKGLRLEDFPEITFRAWEAEYPDYDDALVISVRITNT